MLCHKYVHLINSTVHTGTKSFPVSSGLSLRGFPLITYIHQPVFSCFTWICTRSTLVKMQCTLLHALCVLLMLVITCPWGAVGLCAYSINRVNSVLVFVCFNIVWLITWWDLRLTLVPNIIMFNILSVLWFKNMWPLYIFLYSVVSAPPTQFPVCLLHGLDGEWSPLIQDILQFLCCQMLN